MRYNLEINKNDLVSFSFNVIIQCNKQTHFTGFWLFWREHSKKKACFWNSFNNIGEIEESWGLISLAKFEIIFENFLLHFWQAFCYKIMGRLKLICRCFFYLNEAFALHDNANKTYRLSRLKFSALLKYLKCHYCFQ